MSGVSISVKMDVAQFVDRLTFAGRESVQAIRAGVNAAAVDAKRQFIQAASGDSAGDGATPARVRKQTTPIRRASAGDLSASFRITNKGWDRSPKIVAYVLGNQHRPGSLEMLTFAMTGGGSAPHLSEHMFMIKSRGGRVVLERISSAAGMGKLGRSLKTGLFVKKIYGEAPKTAMLQDGAVPRRRWESTATFALEAQVGARLQTVFDGKSVSDAPLGGE